MTGKIRVAIVDDHKLMRRGLRETLTEFPDFSVVAEGGSADDAISIATRLAPDVILVDVNMPGNGITAVERITKEAAGVKVLVLTVYDNMSNVRSAMMNGAHGYVLKGIDGEELVSAIRLVHAGSKYVAPELAAKLFSESSDADTNAQSATLPESVRLSTLTAREMEIFKLLAKGASNQEIAERLKLSEATVKHYITPLFRKLDVRNRTEAALKARALHT